jgi:hypothetical protein
MAQSSLAEQSRAAERKLRSKCPVALSLSQFRIQSIRIHRMIRTHGRTSRRLACAPGLSGKMQRNSFLAGAEDILRVWKTDRNLGKGTVWRSRCLEDEGGEVKVNGGMRVCRAWGKAGTARESVWGRRGNMWKF